MKKGVTYILVTLLATLIFYGGSGVNFISYCCSDCRSAGVEAVISDKCCDIHEHQHDSEHMHATPHDDCSHHCQTYCCTLERIDFDWDQTSNPVFNFQPTTFDLLSAVIPTAASLLPDIELTETLFVRQEIPPLIVCPRTYLSLLTTLLI